MGRLTGKVALITGAARGQGAAEARLFAAEGATVVATDVLDEPGEELAAKLRSEGGSTVYLHFWTSRGRSSGNQSSIMCAKLTAGSTS